MTTNDLISCLAELQKEMAALNAEGALTAPYSHEREKVLERWAPVHAALLALKEELMAE